MSHSESPVWHSDLHFVGLDICAYSLFRRNSQLSAVEYHVSLRLAHVDTARDEASIIP
jgi:hypothetical protein